MHCQKITLIGPSCFVMSFFATIILLVWLNLGWPKPKGMVLIWGLHQWGDPSSDLPRPKTIGPGLDPK